MKPVNAGDYDTLFTWHVYAPTQNSFGEKPRPGAYTSGGTLWGAVDAPSEGNTSRQGREVNTQQWEAQDTKPRILQVQLRRTLKIPIRR